MLECKFELSDLWVFKAWIVEFTAADLVFLVNWLLSAEHELLLNYE